MMENLHPIFQQALKPYAPPPIEDKTLETKEPPPDAEELQNDTN
jgi:hypothetical protein